MLGKDEFWLTKGINFTSLSWCLKSSQAKSGSLNSESYSGCTKAQVYEVASGIFIFFITTIVQIIADLKPLKLTKTP
jgi:hypothetical protein